MTFIRRWVLTCFVLSVLLGSHGAIYASSASRAGYVPAGSNQRFQQDQVSQGLLVRFKPGINLLSARSFFSIYDLTPVTYLRAIGVWHLKSGVVFDGNMLEKLRQQPEIMWVEENGLMHSADVIPNDNYYQVQQGNLRVIGLEQAWNVTTGAAVAIAVIDTGVDLDHADLREKLWLNTQEIPENGLDDDLNGYVDDVHGWDFVNDDPLPQDDQTHGSHVAGIAAAQTNNTIGIAGVSWGARIMALKALNQSGDGTYADVADAILYAADNGAHILNLSLGGAESSQTIAAAIEYALAAEVLPVAAAGNGGTAVFYPAAFPGVLAVAATDNSDLPWGFSNRGLEVDIAAPGVEIFSTNALGSYSVLTGTSMSTAHVSGLAGLIWSVQPELSVVQVSAVITSTAEDIWSPGWDELTGWGRIDAAEALNGVTIHKIYFPLLEACIPAKQYRLILPLIAVAEMDN